MAYERTVWKILSLLDLVETSILSGRGFYVAFL